MSFNTIQSNMNKAEDPNFISKRRNPFYMNSMKYAGKKHKPQITNDPNLQLEDKNVFKDGAHHSRTWGNTSFSTETGMAASVNCISASSIMIETRTVLVLPR